MCTIQSCKQPLLIKKIEKVYVGYALYNMLALTLCLSKSSGFQFTRALATLLCSSSYCNSASAFGTIIITAYTIKEVGKLSSMSGLDGC